MNLSKVTVLPVCVGAVHDKPGSVFRVNRGQYEAQTLSLLATDNA